VEETQLNNKINVFFVMSVTNVGPTVFTCTNL